jgi:hypothetical protein
MKLLRPFTGTGSVFFPIGPLGEGGTCEFATEACLAQCYVKDPVDFDEETRITPEAANRIYSMVRREPTEVVRRMFLRDLDGLQTPILHWFGSGDCPTRDTEIISAIIKSMPPAVVQMGFTRNRKLWERHKGIFSLTIEREEDAPDQDAMYSIPDYEKETSTMFNPSYQVRGGLCGPMLCKDRDRSRTDLTHYINCKTCYRWQTGCFDRRRP